MLPHGYFGLVVEMLTKIESDEDRDEHVESENLLSSLDEQPSDAELDED